MGWEPLSFPPLLKIDDFTGKNEYFGTLRGWKNHIK
jgi:hypothetical protein